MQPTNLLCRFNHGVLCFKLGLIVEACNDFKMVSAIHQKELAGHFNLAICLSQLGQYKQALETLELITSFCHRAFYEFVNLKKSKNGSAESGNASDLPKDLRQNDQQAKAIDFELV